MDLGLLRKLMATKSLPKVLIFGGEEYHVSLAHIKQIAKVYNLSIKRPDSIREMINQLKTKNLIEHNFLYVFRDSKEFKQNDRLWEILPKLIGNNLVIFAYSSLDKREKFYKTFKKDDDTVNNVEMVEFEKLTLQQLETYVSKMFNLKDREVEMLINICEFDSGRLLVELDKLETLSKATGLKDSNLFQKALADNLLYIPPKDEIFSFIHHVLNNDYGNAFRTYESLKALKTPEPLLLSLLYNGFKNLLLVQGSRVENRTAAHTGLTPFQLGNAKKYLGVFKTPEIESNIRIIREVEYGIKTGKYDTDLSIEYILVSVLRR